jgi:hypothetical protein
MQTNLEIMGKQGNEKNGQLTIQVKNKMRIH